MVLGTTVLANGKGHFGPTDRNDQTCHSGPPSKLVPYIPVPFDVPTEITGILGSMESALCPGFYLP